MITTKEIIEKINSGRSHRRLITYCGQRCWEHFQLNKKEKQENGSNFYMRYLLPSNGDKSRAVLHNSYLSEEDLTVIFSKNDPINPKILIV